MKNINYKSTGIFIIVLLIGTITFSGCSLFQRRYEKVEKKEISVKSIGKKKVVLNNTNGDIKVIKSSVDSVLTIKAEATLHLTKKELNDEREKIKMSVDTLGDIINIKMDFVKEKRFSFFNINFGWDVDYELIVPEGIDVSLDNTNGKAEIYEVNNNVNINLTNGSVKLTRTTGVVSADITNGKIKGELDSTKGLDLKTVNGNISLELGDKFSGKFRMETVNGKISKKSFDFKDVDDDKKYFKGTLGEGNADVKLETTNGKIALTKKGF
jgi:DUF4097 and DUF4098 domain-containing protein YvlB